MKYQIDRVDTHSLATITQAKSETVTAFITIDVHEKRTVADQAVQLMYPDALLSGTKKQSREAFLGAVNLLGASINISIADSSLTITLKSTSQQFGRLLKLVEDMLQSPTFPKNELERIRNTVTNELHEAKENSKQIAYEELQNTLYGENDRKYSFTIPNTIDEVKNTNLRHIKALHRSVLSQTWTCSIAGEQKQIALFASLLKRIKKTTSKPATLVGIHQQKPPVKRAVLTNIPSRHNIDFSIGAPLPITLHHPDYVPLTFAIAVLAKWGGFTGRLMSTVREKEGLTYGIYGRLEGFSGSEQGFWRIMTFFAPDKAVQGLTSTFREISQLHQQGITEDELVKFKTILNTQQVLLNDSVSNLLENLHVYHCHQFTLQEIKEHKAKISALTIEEVNSAIKTYLDPNTLTISGAGPVQAVKKDITEFIKSVS